MFLELLGLIVPVVKIIQNATSDTYDKEVELKHLLDIERRVSDARARALFRRK